MEQVTGETSIARKELISGGFGDEDTADEQERSPATEGLMSSDFESVQPCRVASKGDKLLHDLEDTEPALHGNSVVRIGRCVSIKH
jgi:hypothetical protein